IDDPAFLRGNSIYVIIKLFLKISKFSYLILNDIEGSGKDWLIHSLQQKENTVLELDDFLKTVCDVKQFDWGDFFYLKNIRKIGTTLKMEIIRILLHKLNTTVRAVDDQYIYIYTPSKEIVNLIKENYKIESIKTDFLENLDYPY